MPPSDSRTSRSITGASRRRWRRRTAMRPSAFQSARIWYSTPTPRPTVVPMAAPASPISGKGPRPKMRQGSSTMLTTFATHSDRMASEASPAPRKIALMRNSSRMVALPPRIQAA